MWRPFDAYRVFLITAAVYAFASQMIFTPLAIYYVQAVGMNPLQLVLVGTTLELTIFLCEIPTGVVADTVSRRLSVIIGYALIGFCFVVEGNVPMYPVILAAEVMRGLGETFISGALTAWLADEIGTERLGYALARSGQTRSAAGLAGMLGGVGLATLRLPLPVVVGGVLLTGLSLFLFAFMPERGFRPTPKGARTTWQTMGHTLRGGIRVARRRPVVARLLLIGVVLGLYSEGFDRLWEAHLLTSLTFPAGALLPVVWFGFINVVSFGVGFVAAGVAARRVNMADPRAMSRALWLSHACIVVSVVAFGLARGFWVAVAAFWLATFCRVLAAPVHDAWLNRNVPSEVRATVLSLSGQADALGQFVGGPLVGVVGTLRGLRVALVASGLLLSPASWLYRRAAQDADALE